MGRYSHSLKMPTEPRAKKKKKNPMQMVQRATWPHTSAAWHALLDIFDCQKTFLCSGSSNDRVRSEMWQGDAARRAVDEAAPSLLECMTVIYPK
jgi:hypothetical protein